MEDLKQTVRDLMSLETKEEWFDFKENWQEPAGIGEYISALSNAAAMFGKEYGYLIWGINDTSHEVVGTVMDYHRDVKNEPLQHYLARQLMPDIAFQFQEIRINRKRIVVLVIPAAHQVPTAFNGHRFLRIGSSKVNLNKYPEREARLFDILRNGFPTMENTEADSQELTFRKLFLYYEDRGDHIKQKNFCKKSWLFDKGREI